MKKLFRGLAPFLALTMALGWALPASAAPS